MNIEEIQPIGAMIMLESVDGPEEHIESGIYIPQIAKPKSEILKVIDFGTGEEGIEFPVEIGDFVMVDKRDATVTKIGNRKVIQCKVSDIIAIFDGPTDYDSIEPIEPQILLEEMPPVARFAGNLLIPCAEDESPRYMVYALPEEENEDDEDDLDIGDIVYVTGGVEFDLGKKTLIASKREDIVARVE